MTLPVPADLSAVSALEGEATAELRRLVAERMRRWLRADEAVILDGVGAIGAAAVRTAADLAARLGHAGESRAEAILDELRRLVEAVHAPPPPRWSLFPRLQLTLEERLAAAEPDIARALEALAHERDAMLRDGVTLRKLEGRMADADTALEEAVRLCRAFERAADGAARETAGTDPARAALLRGAVLTRVAERTRDLLTQLVVLRQGRLSLSVLLEGRDAMARAIDRVRLTTVAALRTAVAARRSIGEGTRLTERAAALERPADQSDTIARAVEDMRAVLTER